MNTLFLLLFLSLVHQQSIPDNALYKLSKDRSRTTQVIRDGLLKVKISPPLEDPEYGMVHKVDFDMEMKIQFAGKKRGHEIIHIPVEFFTEQFWLDLMEQKERHFKDFSLQYKHTTEVGCHVVIFYAIRTKPQPGIFKIKHLEIESEVCKGNAGLGSDRLEISGIAGGLNFKAGFDYAN